MVLMLANHYRLLAEKPISAEDFYGDDVRYSTEFEHLESELGKANSLHADQGPDWIVVRDGCELLLQSQSKDLRAVAWLTWSLYQIDSLPGLEAGLGALHYLCTEHWDALHPRKPRTRLAALTWLVSRIDQSLVELPATSTEPGVLTRLATQLRELDICLTGHYADQAPLLLPLCRRLDTLASNAPAEQSTASATTVATQPSKARVIPINQPSADTLGKISDSRDAHKCLRTLQDQARLLSAWWCQESIVDPRAYRLARTLLWLPLDNLPEHDAQQSTTLRGLPADRLANYRERLAQGQPDALLQDVESSLGRSPFWLDGQYIAWQCLQALDAQPAMYEIEIQLALLLRRLPGLEQLCFHDHTPFADDETRAWIDAHILPHTQVPSAQAERSSGNSDSANRPWDEALTKASEQLRKGSLKSGIQLIKQAMQPVRGERERFHWQLAQARLCFQARQYELAFHQLESLYQVLHGSDLERWEPDLAMTVLQLLLDCCNKLPGNPILRQRKSEIYQRLCHLDLEAALDQA